MLRICHPMHALTFVFESIAVVDPMKACEVQRCVAHLKVNSSAAFCGLNHQLVCTNRRQLVSAQTDRFARPLEASLNYQKCYCACEVQERQRQ